MKILKTGWLHLNQRLSFLQGWIKLGTCEEIAKLLDMDNQLLLLPIFCSEIQIPPSNWNIFLRFLVRATCQSFTAVFSYKKRLYKKRLVYLCRHKKLKLQSPLVIVDSSVILKMSTITRESTILIEIQAKIDNQSTEYIHYNKRFHYYEIHYYQRRLY